MKKYLSIGLVSVFALVGFGVSTIAFATGKTTQTITVTLAEVDKAYPIVTICACPEDAGAVHVASSLQELGYINAFPLRGGFDAWKAATSKHKN